MAAGMAGLLALCAWTALAMGGMPNGTTAGGGFRIFCEMVVLMVRSLVGGRG